MVSDKAKVCPSCGINKPVKKSANLVWVALVVVFLFIIFSPKNNSPTNNETTASTPTSNATPADSPISNEVLDRLKNHLAEAMKDPRKVRYMECLGVNPWNEKPEGWTAPTEYECDQLKQVLGAEADARKAALGN